MIRYRFEDPKDPVFINILSFFSKKKEGRREGKGHKGGSIKKKMT